jgi:hypothetical protein
MDQKQLVDTRFAANSGKLAALVERWSVACTEPRQHFVNPQFLLGRLGESVLVQAPERLALAAQQSLQLVKHWLEVRYLGENFQDSGSSGDALRARMTSDW